MKRYCLLLMLCLSSFQIFAQNKTNQYGFYVNGEWNTLIYYASQEETYLELIPLSSEEGSKLIINTGARLDSIQNFLKQSLTASERPLKKHRGKDPFAILDWKMDSQSLKSYVIRESRSRYLVIEYDQAKVLITKDEIFKFSRFINDMN